MGVLHRGIASGACCNPAHVYLGDDFDNAHDKVKQSRQSRVSTRGEQNGQSKLTDEKVRQIRLLYAQGGVSHNQLAKRFSVSGSVICEVINRKIWKHVR